MENKLFVVKFENENRKSLLIRQNFGQNGRTSVQKIRDIVDLEYGLGNTLVATYENNVETLEDLLKNVFLNQKFEIIPINI